MNNEGSAIMIVFVIILLISTIFLSILLITKQQLDYSRKFTEEWESEKELLDILHEIIPKALDDTTPYSDSPTDAKWKVIESCSNSADIKINFTDVSSKINPNWVRKELFQETSLANYLTPNISAVDLQQYRYDNGFSINITNHYKDYFIDEAFEKILTPYSYSNINISGEFTLMNLYSIRTDSNNNSEAFHTKIQNTRIENKILKNSDLEQYLYPNFTILYPVISALPAINIHYAEPVILKEILYYSFGNNPLPNPDSTYFYIINTRDENEILPTDLESIFDINDVSHPIFQYLGTKTWFWKIDMSNDNKKLNAIIAICPVATDTNSFNIDIESFYTSIDNATIQILEMYILDN